MESRRTRRLYSLAVCAWAGAALVGVFCPWVHIEDPALGISEAVAGTDYSPQGVLTGIACLLLLLVASYDVIAEAPLPRAPFVFSVVALAGVAWFLVERWQDARTIASVLALLPNPPTAHGRLGAGLYLSAGGALLATAFSGLLWRAAGRPR